MAMRILERMAARGVQGLSLAVIDQGRVAKVEAHGLLEAGTGRRAESHHRFHACSISKTVTAMTALSLVQDGLVELDTDINRYLGDWRLPADGVTLRHLLSHQAGIVDPDGSFGCLRPGEAYATPAQILRGETRFLPEPLRVTTAPGSRFEYADAGYCIVEHLLTTAADQPFADLVSERVLKPLGLAHSAITAATDPGPDAALACGHDRHGRIIPERRPVYPIAGAAGVWSTAGDLATIAVEVMAAMRGQGCVLASPMAEAMTTPVWHPLIGLGIFLDAPRTQGPWYYHYGWGVGFQGALSFSPSLQSGLVILTNKEPGVPQWHSLIGELAALIAAEMGWPRTPTPALS